MPFRPLVSRRLFVGAVSATVAAALARALETDLIAHSLTVATDRPNWRFCTKCQVMMYTADGPGVCAGGGTHVPAGYRFRLPFGVPGTPNKQTGWRCCRKCQSMYYDGYRAKGKCPAGGMHDGDDRFRYVLPHGIDGTPTAQTEWRFCRKCYAMFYDGYEKKGTCPAGGAHFAQGYGFVLPHERR